MYGWLPLGQIFQVCILELSSIFSEKWIPGGNLGQELLQKFTSSSWIRSGEISCTPHTSFDEVNDSVVNLHVAGSLGALDVQCSHYGRSCVSGADQGFVKNTFGGFRKQRKKISIVSELAKK